MNRPEFERQLAQFPLLAYAFFPTDALEFSGRARIICETQCPRFGKSWACPPAVGTVAECKARCLAYPSGLLIATVSEVETADDMAQTLATRPAHETLTREVAALLKEQGCAVYPLSADSCALCERCTYPAAPCRKPEALYPCIESHGILVTALAEHYKIDHRAEEHTVTWFSLLLYRS